MNDERDDHFGMDRALLTIPEAVVALRISRATLYRLIKDGKLHRAKIGYRSVLRRDEIEALIRAGGI
jgi:excisionase family DNA binding protein